MSDKNTRGEKRLQFARVTEHAYASCALAHGQHVNTFRRCHEASLNGKRPAKRLCCASCNRRPSAVANLAFRLRISKQLPIRAAPI
jgi:hypothetical protein